MGPAMLPRWLAIGVGLSGLALLAFAFIKEGDALERWSLRGPVFVIGAILAFALTIRPFSFGAGLATPGLGLLFAGPLAIIIGGYATPEARLRDLVILALSLTPVLHGAVRRPAEPADPGLPAGAHQPLPRRLVAEGGAARHRRPSWPPPPSFVFLTTRSRRPAPVDVADHSGRI